MNTKGKLLTVAMTAVLAGPLMATPIALASDMGGSVEEQADITNWVANSPQRISSNMSMQHIDRSNLNGTRYIIQWGDTLWAISQATGISVDKLCYDNHIRNANLIYAGDILILNRNGSVPTNYHPNVNPYVVAQTKKTINNNVKSVNIVVSPKITVTQNQDNSDSSTNIYRANNQSTAPAESEDEDQSSSQSQSGQSNRESSQSSKSSSKSSQSSSKDDASQKLADKLSKTADKAKIKLSFDKYDPEKDQAAKQIDLDDDAKPINKAITKKQYKKAIKLIQSHLNDKDDLVYVDYKDGKLNVYVEHHEGDKDSSSSSSSSTSDHQSSQSNSHSDDSEDNDD